MVLCCHLSSFCFNVKDLLQYFLHGRCLWIPSVFVYLEKSSPLLKDSFPGYSTLVGRGFFSLITSNVSFHSLILQASCWEIGWLSCRSPLVCDKPLFSYCFQDSLFVALGILILMCFNVGLFKIELTWSFLKFLKLSSRLVRFRKFSAIVPSYKLSVPFSFAFCDSHNASVALHGGVP